MVNCGKIIKIFFYTYTFEKISNYNSHGKLIIIILLLIIMVILRKSGYKNLSLGLGELTFSAVEKRWPNHHYTEKQKI